MDTSRFTIGPTPGLDTTWITAGLVPKFDTSWITAGLVPKFDTTWITAGLVPKFDTTWITAGLVPKFDTSWITAGLVPKFDTSWITAGLVPEFDTTWITAGLVPKFDTSWITAGFLPKSRLGRVTGPGHVTSFRTVPEIAVDDLLLQVEDTVEDHVDALQEGARLRTVWLDALRDLRVWLSNGLAKGVTISFAFFIISTWWVMLKTSNPELADIIEVPLWAAITLLAGMAVNARKK
ncbi:hypothetical protein [Micromonospora sp. NPDC002717]|uniref:hypothetical protein n=1 Tax=Micromonospora sp. NPDC002717 TaxID=3154424 RepID=UPI00331DB305